MDFRKAFDVIDHNLLLKKLSVCGASQIAWPGSIISGRATTVVKLGHITSEPKPVSLKAYRRDQCSDQFYFSYL